MKQYADTVAEKVITFISIIKWNYTNKMLQHRNGRIFELKRRNSSNIIVLVRYKKY